MASQKNSSAWRYRSLKGPIHALRFCHDAITYCYHYDRFSSAAALSMYYGLFAALNRFEMSLLIYKESSIRNNMFEKPVPVSVSGDGSDVLRFIPARNFMSDGVENAQVEVPANGVTVIPAKTPYKFNYDIPENLEPAILLTAVYISWSNLNVHNFRNQCLKSIRYTEKTTRVIETGGREVKISNNFQELLQEDFNHALAATMNTNSKNFEQIRLLQVHNFS